jgi:5-methylthioadenosine/S-adenosylhomocysteine deaminase
MAAGMTRRGLLGTAAAAGLAAATVGGESSAQAADRSATHPAHRRLPDRGEFVVRGAYVLSMDPKIGDLPTGDVHVRNGQIVAVGRHLPTRGQLLDGAGMVVMPGLIDTHWHMWTSLYRSMSSNSPENAYFALNLRNGAKCLPSDLYNGARLGLADALNTGITTVHDWSHNLRSPAHADANLSAHQEVGLRGRFSYGTPQGALATDLVDLKDIARVKHEWFDSGRLPLMHLGLAGRPPGIAADSVVQTEYDAVRALGLPVSYHVNSTRPQGALQMIAQLSDRKMLGPQTQLIHALYTTEAERAAVRDSGASITSSPWSELLIGYGVSPIQQFVTSGVLFTLSIDTLPLTGTADLWSVMRLATGLARGEAEQEFAINTRRVLEMSTIDAAKGLGLDDVTGSLTPGKRADLIMVRVTDVNTAPFTDPTNTLTLAAGAENVDTVVADGRILKRHGRLTSLDADEVVRDTTQALKALLAR